MLLSQKSIDALNSYGQLLLNKDIPVPIVLFISMLQKFNWKLYTLPRYNNEIQHEWISYYEQRNQFKVRGNVIYKNFS